MQAVVSEATFGSRTIDEKEGFCFATGKYITDAKENHTTSKGEKRELSDKFYCFYARFRQCKRILTMFFLFVKEN